MSTNTPIKQKPVIKIDIETIKKLKESFLEDGQTVVHCNYVAKRKYINGGWVNIYPTTYLVNNNTKLQMLHAENIPVAPKSYVFKNAGELKQFTLFFPVIPKDWEEFSMVEQCDSDDGFVVKNIKRNNSGVYELAIF
jgi:hypothetical protein